MFYNLPQYNNCDIVSKTSFKNKWSCNERETNREIILKFALFETKPDAICVYFQRGRDSIVFYCFIGSSFNGIITVTGSKKILTIRNYTEHFPIEILYGCRR